MHKIGHGPVDAWPLNNLGNFAFFVYSGLRKIYFY